MNAAIAASTAFHLCRLSMDPLFFVNLLAANLFRARIVFGRPEPDLAIESHRSRMIGHGKVRDRLNIFRPFFELWMDRLKVRVVVPPRLEQSGHRALIDPRGGREVQRVSDPQICAFLVASLLRVMEPQAGAG